MFREVLQIIYFPVKKIDDQLVAIQPPIYGRGEMAVLSPLSTPEPSNALNFPDNEIIVIRLDNYDKRFRYLCSIKASDLNHSLLFSGIEHCLLFPFNP